ncbi:MAG: DUF1080 domain-containing protein [Planctomycetota bacterium]
MRILTTLGVPLTAALAAATALADHHATGESRSHDAGWVELFNGKDLSGWKVSENPETFRVQNGKIIVKGPRAHAFYAGEVGGADFTNFELLVELMTKPNANSGVFFHTRYQDKGWPGNGYEVQVNQTQRDRIKTGSIYAVKNVMDVSPAKDNEWYTQHIIVKGKTVTVKVNGEVVNEYTEPDGFTPPEDRPGRKFSRGTIALQGHDPGSEVHYRSVKIKLLD